MNAAEALDLARAAGIRIMIDDGDLVLEASALPPPAVLDLLARNKAGILTLLRPTGGGWSPEDWQIFFNERAGIDEFDGGLQRTEAESRAYECCVIELLNRNPTPSPAGRCVWCGGLETQDAVVLPYGSEPGSHAWLHAECWGPWQVARRAEAVKSLTLMGLSPPPIDSPAPPFTPTPRCELITQPEVSTSELEQKCIARRGLVQKAEGGAAFLHYCEKCGDFAPFGFGASLRHGRFGRWYCRKHRPRGNAP
jgi:hypothetical protein